MLFSFKSFTLPISFLLVCQIFHVDGQPQGDDEDIVNLYVLEDPVTAVQTACSHLKDNAVQLVVSLGLVVDNSLNLVGQLFGDLVSELGGFLITAAGQALGSFVSVTLPPYVSEILNNGCVGLTAFLRGDFVTSARTTVDNIGNFFSLGAEVVPAIISSLQEGVVVANEENEPSV